MSDEKSFSVCQEMLPLFRAVLILITIFQILMTLKLLLGLRANLIATNELANLQKQKKFTLGINLLHNWPIGTKMLRIYRMISIHFHFVSL